MTMNIEDKFNKNISWMLDELQADMLVSKKEETNFYFITEDGAPTRREQERVLAWLQKLGAIERVSDLHSNDFYSTLLAAHPFARTPIIGEKVRIDKQVFTPLRKIFSDDWEKQPAAETLAKAEKLRAAKKIDTTPPAKPVLEKVPFWSKETSEVIYLEKSCDVPAGNQRVLCGALFAAPLSVWIDEDDVVGNFSRDGKQSFYDAQRLLNQRIQDKLGIRDFVEYQTAKARINPATIKKLNHSEK